MARENQGLQIALIAFVTVTIILSVTTYLGFKSYSDEFKAKEAALAEGTKAKNEARSLDENVKDLKKLIGAADTEAVDKIKDTAKEDMKQYGAGYPDDALFYRKLISYMKKTIDEKNADLEAFKDKLPAIQDKYDADLKAKDVQLEQYKTDRNNANDDLAKEQAKYQSQRKDKNDQLEDLKGNLEAKRKELTEIRGKVDTEKQAAEVTIKGLGDRVKAQEEVITGYTAKNVGTPSGQITWVNQRNSTVWINLGRADLLTPQVNFSVYPPDVTSLTDKGATKAKIEVTQILGEHLAEARVVDDEVGNPIVPGDKLFTPLWNSGKPRHFALAGVMAIDADGHSELQTVLNLIRINGGVVDCYIDDTGVIRGARGQELKITTGASLIPINTNCLILGEAPTDRSASAQRDAFTKLQKDADELRLPKMQLADLLQRMGWKNMSHVARFGPGANPDDFRAKPEGGVLRKSTGDVTDLFKKRQPPKEPSSAY